MSNGPENPFVYDQASLMPPDVVAQYYIDDHNHGRLLRSRRNIFLVGERGSGKTMALLYNTLAVQREVAKHRGEPVDLRYVGALIPANTPITHRQEYKLLDPFPARSTSEHFLAVAIVFHLCEALETLSGKVSDEEAVAFRTEVEFYLGATMPEVPNVFAALALMAEKENIRAQQYLDRAESDEMYPQALSFGSLVLPILRALRRFRVLADTHFMLLVDDANYLHGHQTAALNSWIAYRDRNLYSFKVATTRIGRQPMTTAGGGDILEGHDYMTINMEHPIHHAKSEFGRFAEKVVKRRLEGAGIATSPKEFFPQHERLRLDLQAAAERVRRRVERIASSDKDVADYVYKQKWAEYIRTRRAQANRPRYSGFGTLTFIATGVVRNLLDPCWWMWDAAMSERTLEEWDGLKVLPARIQADKILQRSDAAWERLKALDQTIDGCSRADGQKVRVLFEGLAGFFVERLMKHQSEPGATSFSISSREEVVMQELLPLLDIAIRAQMLYVRTGPGKRRGEREDYYIPNRILWPSRSLDPHGQHARASIRAVDLLNAANGRPIPFAQAESDQQGSLFGTGNTEDAR